MAGFFTILTDIPKAAGALNNFFSGVIDRVFGDEGDNQESTPNKSSYELSQPIVETKFETKAPTMFASLQPPALDSEPTEENVRQLRCWLYAHIAGGPLATNTYTFYEKIDEYLGPWGDEGYPIGYGKKYNVLFTSNEDLMSDPVARQWVEDTTLILQKELADFIIDRYEEGTLAGLTETELREAAFNSHPKAYKEGGLENVACQRPHLIPVISMIPSDEFSPNSESFDSTVAQVFKTASMILPDMAKNCRPLSKDESNKS